VRGSPDTEKLLAAARAVVARRSFRAWLVGGSVRDRELGRFSSDVDICVAPAADRRGGAAAARHAALTVAREVAAETGFPSFTLSAEFGAHRVVGENATLDLTALRGGSLEEDLGLRDFTMNAMALPLPAGALVDPFGGREDLSAGRLAAVSPHIFRDDPVRLMRALRFTHTLHLKPDEPLRLLVSRQAHLIRRAAPERVVSELCLAWEAADAAALVACMHTSGLLRALIPETGAVAGAPAGGGTGSLVSVLERLRRLEHLLREPGGPPFDAKEVRDRLAGSVDGSMRFEHALFLAGLLLEAGASAASGSPSPVVSLGSVPLGSHAELGGVKMMGSIAKRLRLSGRVSAVLAAAIRGRDLLLCADAAVFVEEPSRATGAPAPELVRIVRVLEPWALEAAVVARADADAQGDGRLRAAADALGAWWLERRRRGVPAIPVDGRDIAVHVGLSPGPLLGRVVEEVAVAVEAGAVSGRDEVLDYARRVAESL